MKEISRRLALQALALTSVSASSGVSGEAHHMEHTRNTAKSAGPYTPKAFNAHQYTLLRSLCDSIIPPDDTSGGAVEAGAPALIDLLAHENPDYQTRLSGGMQWLDSTCQDRYGYDYLKCSADQQNEILHLIAYREHAQESPTLSSGIAFFSFLRDLTLGGYFTSEIGMKTLPYLGNQFVVEFPGCLPIPES